MKLICALVGGAGLLAGIIGWASRDNNPVKGEALLFLSTDCPVADKYTPRLNRIFDEYANQGFVFKAYFPNELETREGVEKYIQERAYKFDWQMDPGGSKALSEEIEVLPTVVVYDAGGRRIYHGPIDDNQTSDFVRSAFLAETLEALARGKVLQPKRIESFGCYLMAGEPIPSREQVNFAEHVASILYKSCVECHRPGEVAPFSLLNYDEARKWSLMIAKVTGERTMPPWRAVSGYGHFEDENRLTEAQIETLKRWAEAGAPRGDASREPKPPTFSSAWALGEPDMILKPSRPFNLPAEGRDVYRNFVMKTEFKETKWVRAMDVRPGNSKVVHHVIAFLDERGRSHRLEANQNDGQDGYSSFGGIGFMPDGAIGGWAPGLRPRYTYPGTAFELKPGTTIVLQTHYSLSGKPESDQTEVALYFADKPPDRAMQLAWLADLRLRIPAGAKSHKVTVEYPVQRDITIYGGMPHMHLIGRSMKVWVELPDTAEKPVVWIDNWDFNWQMTYTFREPMKVPRGSRIVVEAVFDNSEDNPNNPNNPPQQVTWGERTADEMLLFVMPFTVDVAAVGQREGSIAQLLSSPIGLVPTYRR